MSDKDIEQLLVDNDINLNSKFKEETNYSFSDEIESEKRISSLERPRIKPRRKWSPKQEMIESSPEHDLPEIQTNQPKNSSENQILQADDDEEENRKRDSVQEEIENKISQEENENEEQKREEKKKSFSGMRQMSRGLSKLQKLRPGSRSKKLQNDKKEDSIVSDNENNRTTNPIEQSVDNSSNILNIKVHRIENLKFNRKIIHPLIQIHIIDLTTGKYLLKKQINKCVTSYYENKLLDFILPVMTKPSYNIQNSSMIWDENILYNEDYDYFVKPNIIFFFEVVEFETLTDSSNINRFNVINNLNNWWQRIAWAFLKPVGTDNERKHTGHKVRLQLYKPLSNRKSKSYETTELYNWWKNKKMSSISGILTVTLESQSRLLLNLEPTLRSFFPIQSEISLKNSSYTVNESNNFQNVENRGKIQNKKLVKNDKILLWDRIEGQSCKIPKTRWHSLIGSGRGCFCLKFSNDGRQMSCASPINSSNEYSIFIYEIPSTDLLSHFGHHNGIIYELDWSHDNRKLLSASNDCTARVWKLNDSYECIGSVLLPHPSFLYSAKFHIKNSDIVLTAGFDGIVRVWSINDSNQIELIQELNPCKGSVLCLSWNFTNNDEFQIFSGSNDGIIRVMSQNETEWEISKTIALKDLKNISINSISVHPNGNKLIIFCRDGIHRMIDYKLEIIIQVYKGSINFSHLIRGSISPCGQLVFIGSEDNTVLVWKTETGERVHTYFDLGLNGIISYVEYHPFDHILAVCGLDTNTSIHLYKYFHESNKTHLNPIEKRDKDFHQNEVPLSLRTKFRNAMTLLDILNDSLTNKH